MRFTLRQLEVFLAVARSDSVSRAARQLAMSQSAVSGALLDLEAQFELKLFDRIGKRLELSELGRSMRARAEALHEQAREFEAQLTKRNDMGLLRVGATLTIGNYLVVPLMARFVREHAGARVTLHVANTAEIARKLANFEPCCSSPSTSATSSSKFASCSRRSWPSPGGETTSWSFFARPSTLSPRNVTYPTTIYGAERGSCVSPVRARAKPSTTPCTASAAAYRSDQERGDGGPRCRLRLTPRAGGRIPP
jgi:hypothetical protein